VPLDTILYNILVSFVQINKPPKAPLVLLNFLASVKFFATTVNTKELGPYVKVGLKPVYDSSPIKENDSLLASTVIVDLWACTTKFFVTLFPRSGKFCCNLVSDIYFTECPYDAL